MKLIKQTLAKPQVRTALVSFGQIALDRCLDYAIMKLREFEEALSEYDITYDKAIDAEFEVIVEEDVSKM
jgi:hypothetical protein